MKQQTFIDAPSSTKNKEKKRDPEMHSAKKGNQWRFGMKCHVGLDAGTGYVHTMEVTPANIHDVTVASELIREDDEVVYGAAYLGPQKAIAKILGTMISNCINSAIRSRGSFAVSKDFAGFLPAYDKLDVIFLAFVYFALIVDALM